jgi:hypothetical protein
MSDKTPEELIARHEAFLNCDPVDRPLLGFWLGGYFPGDQFPHAVSEWHNGQPLSPTDIKFESFKPDYEHLYQIHREANDDFFYVASAYWGIPWLEAILGCPVFTNKSNAWADSCLPELNPVDINLDKNHWFNCLMEFTQKLVRLADGRFPVCPPLLRGPGDAACALRGPMNFVTDFIDDPEKLQALLHLCTSIRMDIIARLHAILPAWHNTHAAGGYPSKLWSHKTVTYHQEDSAALLNPKLLKTFLLPLHQKMASTAQINFIHLHSACLYPLDILLADNTYNVIEINLDHKGTAPALPDFLPILKSIQSQNRPLLLWGKLTLLEWSKLKKELSTTGLSLQPIIESPKEIAPLLHLFS